LKSDNQGMKRNIALLAGGFSGEYAVSMKSAETIRANMDVELFDCHLLEIKRDTWSVLRDNEKIKVDLDDFSFDSGQGRIKFDYAYIIIHGTPGEDGRLQGYLEMKGVPYSTGPVLNTALTFSKVATQRLLKSNGLAVADHMIVTAENRPEAEEIASRLGLPCFVKPSESGSSLGVSKVKLTEAMDTAIDHALEFSSEVIIESFLDGRELACGVLRTAEGVQALPVTEIIAQSDFFDYKAKYEDEATREETPAAISDDATMRCQELSRQVYELTGCDGIARVDFFICGEELFIVEVNTVPGMSKESIVPKQLRAVGIDLKEYITWKISTDIAKKGIK